MQEKLFKISETAKIVDHQFSEKLCSGLLKVLCYLLKVEGEVALQKITQPQILRLFEGFRDGQGD